MTMRVARHDCFDRWVMEFTGSGPAPGWSVTPYGASTFLVDPSGEPLSPPLEGTASLDVAFGAWYDGTPLDQSAYAGPLVLRPGDTTEILEVRLISGFEGISHAAIGLAEPRPYKVAWLTDPIRLVIDVSTA
ncbi:hypothetical protein RN606_01645 [Demequina capsici]|uniref:AMIN-like domain-containing protein n=2 Tax=Demequina capsici TaxID=3075620 RepID=A0AA96F902_9MICO|nr:hypothetical protein [Demequina sp. OYTSA14]WNM24880.1 hypothetical protein RN606_01645 [Demequina sp. OYTSA14]